IPVATTRIITTGISKPVLPEDRVLTTDLDKANMVCIVTPSLSGRGSATVITGATNGTFISAYNPEDKRSAGNKAIASQICIPETWPHIEARPDRRRGNIEQLTQKTTNNRLILRYV